VASKIREAFSSPQKAKRAVAQGDPRLLSYTMSNAAAHYGVSADVIPKRIRLPQETSANG
jgi:hypothetical protein